MFRRSLIFLFVILYLVSMCVPAFAISEKEKSFLSLYFSDDELKVISATRSLKSISRVAENVEVVTAEDIELMNAHTLADVLDTVNGVQVGFGGASPGSGVTAQIDGSRIDHVVVLVDGVKINDIAGGVALIELIPVQMIAKVEVIKGPASSVWGSSLGGVVNVITKAPSQGSVVSGLLSGSYGKEDTGDFRAEATGRSGDLGYYLSGGRLETDGLRPRDDNWHNSLYSKLTYDFSRDTSAALTFLYTKSEEQQGDFDALGFALRWRYELIVSSLSVKSRLSDNLSVEASAHTLSQLATRFETDLPTGDVTETPGDDKQYGGSIKLDLHQGMHNIVGGADYDYYKTKFSGLSYDEKIAAVYMNDTISLGRLSIVPGLRLDSVNVEGTSLDTDFLSPSLGVTHDLGEKTILRAVVARGFNVPGIFNLTSDSLYFVKNPNLGVERVWSYQAGVETGALQYVWLKLTGFRHDVKNAIEEKDLSVEDGTWTLVNKGKVRLQGVEVAMRTLPYHNLTLMAAVTYIHSKDLETGEKLRNNPQYTYDIGLEYKDGDSLRALLRGRTTWWDATQDMNAKYNGFIVDANVIKRIYKKGDFSAEAFLTGHNLLNGSSYWIEYYKNASRWFEAGLRVKF